MFSSIFICLVAISASAIAEVAVPDQNNQKVDSYQPNWNPTFRLPPIPVTYFTPPVDNQPPVSYGPPSEEATTTVQPSETTTQIEIATDEPKILLEESGNLKEEKQEEGVYYIYHPNGLLQKVNYATKDDTKNMAFSARLKYENVEPIVSPVYTYDPQSFVLSRVF